eukprot:GFYU01031995.1.p1 GENE.GFYU01031995.1~~GFYU01031995.1.p1  ORF type:complete len:170 (+),score=38.37 GFYU01031995.1:108-617(+)
MSETKYAKCAPFEGHTNDIEFSVGEIINSRGSSYCVMVMTVWAKAETEKMWLDRADFEFIEEAEFLKAKEHISSVRKNHKEKQRKEKKANKKHYVPQNQCDHPEDKVHHDSNVYASFIKCGACNKELVAIHDFADKDHDHTHFKDEKYYKRHEQDYSSLPEHYRHLEFK